jgi:hypothetical protein
MAKKPIKLKKAVKRDKNIVIHSMPYPCFLITILITDPKGGEMKMVKAQKGPDLAEATRTATMNASGYWRGCDGTGDMRAISARETSEEVYEALRKAEQDPDLWEGA